MIPNETLDWCEQFENNVVLSNVKRKKRMLALKAMQVCKSALKKQIPKKPTPHKVEVEKIKIGNANWGKGTTIYKCPNCNEFISRTYDYCYKCGQALDWSDTK